MTTQTIAVSTIEIGPRLRDLDETHAAALAANIAEDGQQVPIIVRRLPNGKYKLLAGRHRVRACDLLAIDVRAEVRQSTDDPEDDELVDELTEIAENMRRKELGYVEFGAHLDRDQRVRAERVARKQLKEAEAAAAAAKAATGKVGNKGRLAVRDAAVRLGKLASQEPPPRTAGSAQFAREVAEQLQKSVRAVNDDLKVYRDAQAAAAKLGVDLSDVRGTVIDNKANMRALSALATTTGTATAQPVVARAVEAAKAGDTGINLVKISSSLERARDRDNRTATDGSSPFEAFHRDLAGYASEAKTAITKLYHKLQEGVTEFPEHREYLLGQRTEMRAHADFFLSRAQSYRSGTAAKLKGAPAHPGSTPAETKARTTAKRDQDANAKIDVETLKKVLR